MNPYESIGEAATKALIKAAEKWPKAISMQSDLALNVKEYQLHKLVGKEVGSWFCGDK